MSTTATQSDLLSVRRVGRGFELKMLSDTAVLRPTRLAVEEYGREAGLSEEAVGNIGLVLNEALANVMRHGYSGAKDRPILVTFDRVGDGSEAAVEIRIRDWSKPFDPAKLPDFSAPRDADSVKPGGLGLLCMRRMMDRVEFTALPDGMLLVLAKKIDKGVDGKHHT